MASVSSAERVYQSRKANKMKMLLICLRRARLQHLRYRARLSFDLAVAHGLQGTAVAQWLRRCATNRKVAGSIPDGVTGFFH